MTTKENSNTKDATSLIHEILEDSFSKRKELEEKKLETLETLKKLGLAFFAIGFGILISFMHAKVILEVARMHNLEFISKLSTTQIFIFLLIAKTLLIKYKKSKNETYKEYLEKTKKIIVHSLLIISFLYFVGYILS